MGADDDRWFLPAFEDGSWKSGTAGIGFGANDSIADQIGTGIVDEMKSVNSSAYVRIPFWIESLAETAIPILRMTFDDGFAAYLNGELVASSNAPDQLAWNSRASSSNRQNVDAQAFRLNAHRHLIAEGDNMLAIHLLNRNTSGNDAYLIPSLELHSIVDSNVSASAILYSGPIPITEDIRISARSIDPLEVSVLVAADFAVRPEPLVGDSNHDGVF